MTTLIMAGLGAGAGLGIVLVVLGWRGVAVLPSATSFTPSGTSKNLAWAWPVLALVVAGLVVAVTGWVGAGIGSFALVLSVPWFVIDQNSNSELLRTEAIATWTEMIRDNMAGAAGLEQAVVATTAIAPNAIAEEVQRLAVRLEQMNLPQALEELGRDLNHSSADLVVVALVNAARMEARDLGSLLSRLADSIRADVRMRQRIGVGRARIRTASRIVVAVTLATAVLVYVTSEDLLEGYDTATGQVVLLAIFALLVGALWMMDRFAGLELPERFTVRSLESAAAPSSRSSDR